MGYLSKKRFSTRDVVLMLTLVFLGIGVLTYAVTIPYSFTSGTTISAKQVNENFYALDTAVDALEAQTTSYVTQLGNLNYSSATVTTTWTKLATPTLSFTKNRSDTKIEATANSRFSAGTFTSATGIWFQVRVDDTAPVIGNDAASTTSGSTDFLSMYAVFSGLAAGPHTVSLWARTNAGSSSGVIVDPGGWGGKIFVKESLK